MKLSRLLLALLALPSLLFAAESKAVKNGSVVAQLVTDAAAIVPGQPFTVALRLQHEPHWHSYWIAAGTGYPTSLAWTLPEGFKAGDIQWPTPHVVKDGEGKITGNGYENEAYMLVEITPPATLAAGSAVKLAATAEWLMCLTVCMPGDAKLELSLPAAAAGAADAKWTQAITDARAKLPDASTGWALTATHDGTTATLRLRPQAGTTHQPKELHFFAADGFTDYAKPAVVRADNGGWVLELPLDAAADKATARLTGVLASANGWAEGAGYDGLAIDVPFTKDAPKTAAVTAPSSGAGCAARKPRRAPARRRQPPRHPFPRPRRRPRAQPDALRLPGARHQDPRLRQPVGQRQGQDRAARPRVHPGVLGSFWALAGALLALRAGGAQLGWGFQLQSPAFVFGMAVFLLIFALNLSGLFEVGLAATGVGGSLQMQQGYAGSFFTGALAVLVATPCSAPFLAPALGAALSLSAFESLLVFTAIAVGLALPYLLLSIFPSALKFLPRPGAWMETFKQFMAFPLYATVGWLLWVLAGQTKDDDNALLLIAFGFVLVAMAAWAYGRFGQAHGKPGRQLFGRVAAAALLAGGLYTGWPSPAQAAPRRAATRSCGRNGAPRPSPPRRPPASSSMWISRRAGAPPARRTRPPCSTTTSCWPNSAGAASCCSAATGPTRIP
jgi:DsbC/DsbD-like thiol-disulfide interchange protein/cytochrome c biogenesis protein CcdA